MNICANFHALITICSIVMLTALTISPKILCPKCFIHNVIKLNRPKFFVAIFYLTFKCSSVFKPVKSNVFQKKTRMSSKFSFICLKTV